MAIDTPTTKIKASGYRKKPPSLKKLMTELKKFICALLKILVRFVHGIQSDLTKSEVDLLLNLLRCSARSAVLWPIRFYDVEIDHFTLEFVAVHGRQSLIQQAVHRLARQIADIRTLPRHDVHDLRLLTVAGYG